MKGIDKMQKRRTFILSIIVIAICTAVIQGDKITATSIKDLEKEISELEDEQKSKKDEQDKIQSEKNEIEQKMTDNLSEQEAVQQQLDTLTKELEETEEEIVDKEKEIKVLEEEIEEIEEEITILEEEIIELEERIEIRANLLKDRLRSIQENGGMVQYVTVILGSESFSDLITRSTTVSTIMNQDKNIVESLANDQEALENKLVEVEEKKVGVEAKKEEQEIEKKKLDRLKELLSEQEKEQQRLLDKLVQAYDEFEEHQLSLEEEQQIIADQAAALEKAKEVAKQNLQTKKEEEARRKALEEAAQNNNGGNINKDAIFIRPLDIWRITSSFGRRVHPVSGQVGKMHYGIDLGANPNLSFSEREKTPIYAAQTGVVSTVTYNPCCGLGNHVVITHVIDGKTYATVYGHLSKIHVQQGEVVELGQTIANMGTTGTSTAPHLHFEVHPGGYNGQKSAVNPRPYLP